MRYKTKYTSQLPYNIQYITVYTCTYTVGMELSSDMENYCNPIDDNMHYCISVYLQRSGERVSFLLRLLCSIEEQTGSQCCELLSKNQSRLDLHVHCLIGLKIIHCDIHKDLIT